MCLRKRRKELQRLAEVDEGTEALPPTPKSDSSVPVGGGQESAHFLGRGIGTVPIEGPGAFQGVAVVGHPGARKRGALELTEGGGRLAIHQQGDREPPANLHPIRSQCSGRLVEPDRL